jgi:hypothetical protein
MSIVSFYNKVLGVASLISDVEGNVSATLAGSTRPFTIEGKRLMLPTNEVQAMADKSKILVFHPLAENLLRGESEVMQHFRNAINLTLNMRLLDLLGHIVELAASPAQHGHLKPAHLTLITILKDADQKTFEAWDAIRQAMPLSDSSKCIAHIFIKKNAQIGGRNFRKGAIVSFPLYEELTKEGSNGAFGVKLRKKDHAAFKQLLEAVFPGIEEKNSYSRGGEATMAPTLDALLRAVLGLAGQINSVVDTFEDVLDISTLRYDDAWVEDAANLDKFEGELRLLPPQVGNEGSTDNKMVQPAAASPGAAPGTVAMPMLTASGTPAYTAAGATATGTGVITSEGKVDMAQLMRSNPQMAAFATPVGVPGYAMGMYGGYANMQPTSGAQALRQQGPTWNSPLAGLRTNAF